GRPLHRRHRGRPARLLCGRLSQARHARADRRRDDRRRGRSRPMTLLLTNDEVDRLLDMRECLDVFESAYRELGQGIGVTRTVSQLFTRTRHDADALYSFKSMDGVVPFLDVAAIRIASEI